ncbi:MAG: cytochrome c-553 [Gammaproteobacteria bacterium]|nr:cytochrome c-553 [Gammaproteobacteria bacterium]MDH4254151.1 cytochrome c-553 [Gammaproteobacteria bacterium]MDH5309482.1 cytochrome c-553 [Gammaproteobacteria bacterium]
MNVIQGARRTAVAVAMSLGWLVSPLAQADVSDIVKECDSCHGADGVSTESKIPTIAGFSEFVFEEYMYQYQDEARPCREVEYPSGDEKGTKTTMCEEAAELSEEQISELTGYYAGKSFKAATQEFDAALAAEGASIHKRDCEKCHTDGGSYAGDDAGLLAGQWMGYLQQVFADYAAGERSMMEDKMKEKVDALDEASTKALIHYYASQQ